LFVYKRVGVFAFWRLWLLKSLFVTWSLDFRSFHFSLWYGTQQYYSSPLFAVRFSPFATFFSL